ncbi:uncharacterized protein LOC117315162 [Pecten maximus]|uniref:uncharacterized protein LOC117315162 n=1 Tax=Pecten maximus TaxID=6579 RepID=UPI001458BC70|nr:uncharacterized protein LOC117315162 [Pecten maximus]
MKTNVPFVLQEQQEKQFQSLTVTELECVEIEESTRSQSRDPMWHKLRSERITAFNAGEIAKRRADGQKLAERLKSARSYQSAAMKRGIESEATAAQAYSQVSISCLLTNIVEKFHRFSLIYVLHVWGPRWPRVLKLACIPHS